MVRKCFKIINKIQIHEEILMQMHDTYIAKNHDYGDSYASIRKEYPTSILVRIADKVSRLKTLLGGAEAKVQNESIDDTLLDLANYCVMELVERNIDIQYLKEYQKAQEVKHAVACEPAVKFPFMTMEQMNTSRDN